MKFSEISLAAAIWLDTKIKPAGIPGIRLVEFVFPDVTEVEEAASAYITGKLQGNLKDFATKRDELYHLKDEVKSTGGWR